MEAIFDLSCSLVPKVGLEPTRGFSPQGIIEVPYGTHMEAIFDLSCSLVPKVGLEPTRDFSPQGIIEVPYGTRLSEGW
jgi:hypothetical protein